MSRPIRDTIACLEATGGGRLLADFDDGRSKSFYCRSAALLDLAALESALDAAARKIETGRIPPDDAKTRARILLALLDAAE